MEQIKKATKVVTNLLPYFFFLIAVILILGVVSSFINKSIPSFFGFSAAIVESPSMEDTILTGDLIFIQTVDPDGLEEGDIITFWWPNKVPAATVTHRIIDIKETDSGRLFTTMGDHNNGSNDWEIDFSEDYVIGRYIGKSTWLGQTYQWITSAGVGVLYGFIVAIFALIAVFETTTIVKELTAAKKIQIANEKQIMLETELARLRAEEGSSKTKA